MISSPLTGVTAVYPLTTSLEGMDRLMPLDRPHAQSPPWHACRDSIGIVKNWGKPWAILHYYLEG
jgi:hypothetical protein